MSNEKLIIVSWNIKSLGQGIQAIKCRCDIPNFFKKIVSQLEVILS
jgi:hypothetical protein